MLINIDDEEFTSRARKFVGNFNIPPALAEEMAVTWRAKILPFAKKWFKIGVEASPEGKALSRGMTAMAKEVMKELAIGNANKADMVRGLQINEFIKAKKAVKDYEASIKEWMKSLTPAQRKAVKYYQRDKEQHRPIKTAKRINYAIYRKTIDAYLRRRRLLVKKENELKPNKTYGQGESLLSSYLSIFDSSENFNKVIGTTNAAQTRAVAYCQAAYAVWGLMLYGARWMITPDAVNSVSKGAGGKERVWSLMEAIKDGKKLLALKKQGWHNYSLTVTYNNIKLYANNGAYNYWQESKQMISVPGSAIGKALENVNVKRLAILAAEIDDNLSKAGGWKK